jgi:hypothetical protein
MNIWLAIPWWLAWGVIQWRLLITLPLQNVVGMGLILLTSGLAMWGFAFVLGWIPSGHFLGLLPDRDRWMEVPLPTLGWAWLCLIPTIRAAVQCLIRWRTDGKPLGLWVLGLTSLLGALHGVVLLHLLEPLPGAWQLTLWAVLIPMLALVQLLLFPWTLDKRQGLQPADPWLGITWLMLVIWTGIEGWIRSG